MCDGEGLVDEGVGEDVGLCFREGEHEVVAPVPAQRQRAVVLAEECLAAHSFGLLRDVDVAVAHALHLAVGQEGFHLDALGAHEVEGVESVVGSAEGHEAVDHCRHLGFGFVCFHFVLSCLVRRRSDSLAIYSRTSSSPPLRVNSFFLVPSETRCKSTPPETEKPPTMDHRRRLNNKISDRYYANNLSISHSLTSAVLHCL